MTDNVDAVVAALDAMFTSSSCTQERWKGAKEAHGLLPAPAPSFRWPGVEVVQARDGDWCVQTGTHWLSSLHEWNRHEDDLEPFGEFTTRDEAISALNDPRTPPPPHVAEGKASDDVMESRCSDFRRTKCEAHSEREIALACSFARSEVASATAALKAQIEEMETAHLKATHALMADRIRVLKQCEALTAERDRLAARVRELEGENTQLTKDCTKAMDRVSDLTRRVMELTNSPTRPRAKKPGRKGARR